MRLLRIAVERRRWDLAAHTIVLATANVLRDGDKSYAGKGVSGKPSLKIAGRSGVERVKKTGGREFEGKKGRSKG